MKMTKETKCPTCGWIKESVKILYGTSAFARCGGCGRFFDLTMGDKNDKDERTTSL